MDCCQEVKAEQDLWESGDPTDSVKTANFGYTVLGWILWLVRSTAISPWGGQFREGIKEGKLLHLVTESPENFWESVLRGHRTCICPLPVPVSRSGQNPSWSLGRWWRNRQQGGSRGLGCALFLLLSAGHTGVFALKTHFPVHLWCVHFSECHIST